MTGRASLVVAGEVLVAAVPGAVERAEAVGVADGRIVAVGSRREVTDAAARGARVIDVGRQAVIPGLHDFHLHLVGLARTRLGVLLDDAPDGAAVEARLGDAARRLGPDDWLIARGFSERQLAGTTTAALESAVAGRRAFVTSHDGHSAWASAEALRHAGVSANTTDPDGGRIERGTDGRPTGVLRETAMDLVSGHVPRAQGDRLRSALEATLDDLAGHGLTGASEAGDYTDEQGTGADAALGDSYSTLTDLGDVLDGRLRMTIGIPADAIEAAAARDLRTGHPLANRRTMRFGWAKEYADGSLGSGTAALFAPRTCGDGDDLGLLRVSPDEFDRLFSAARAAGIGMAVHAIGDRAAAAVLDAVERAGPRRSGSPADRMEHLQLIGADDRRRLVALGVTASIQPIHAPADRDLVDACWQGREDDAYAWRALADAGALLAAGSDAPVESVDPWLGIHAAVHRSLPEDPRGAWRPAQALSLLEALHAYTLGPARALGVGDEGHLRVGARADLAVLTVELDDLLEGRIEPAGVRAELTMVDGRPA